MRMRLAHKWNTTTQQQNWERKKIRNRRRQTERMEHKLMFYDYFMIFMDRILCDRNLFIFLFSCSLSSDCWRSWLLFECTQNVCVCVSQAIYYRYHVGVVLAMSGTRSGNVRPIMVLIVSYHRKLTEFSYKALVVPDIIHCSILLTVHLSLFTTSKWILFTLARILTSTTTRFVTNK